MERLSQLFHHQFSHHRSSHHQNWSPQHHHPPQDFQLEVLFFHFQVTTRICGADRPRHRDGSYHGVLDPGRYLQRSSQSLPSLHCHHVLQHSASSHYPGRSSRSLRQRISQQSQLRPHFCNIRHSNERLRHRSDPVPAVLLRSSGRLPGDILVQLLRLLRDGESHLERH